MTSGRHILFVCALNADIFRGVCLVPLWSYFKPDGCAPQAVVAAHAGDEGSSVGQLNGGTILEGGGRWLPASLSRIYAVGGAVDISHETGQSNFFCARQAVIRDVHGGGREILAVDPGQTPSHPVFHPINLVLIGRSDVLPNMNSLSENRPALEIAGLGFLQFARQPVNSRQNV